MNAAETFISNHAGLVLLTPFLPHFFERLELTHENQFTNETARQRGACLLHYAASGVTELGNPAPVARLLCGLPPGASSPTTLPLSEHEITVTGQLLQAVIQQWPAAGQSSIAGLRGNFLEREGRLQCGAESDSLTVARRAYDILLDQLPWSVSIIRAPWMSRPLHVHWQGLSP